jgi:hypothetical protein
MPESLKPLTDGINALTAYANEVTGESDTTLSEAVHTLADGYGQGGAGGDTIWPTLVERTVTEINDKDGLCKVVGYSAFHYCKRLASAIFPAATKIGNLAFYACAELKTLVLRKSDSICTLASYTALNDTPIRSGTGYIYVPSSLIETYKTAPQWSTYAAQFRALEDYTVDGTITGDLDPNKI